MSRRRLLLSLVLLVLALAAALAVLPARWLMPLVPTHWPLAMVDAQGTVWSGTATLAIGPDHRRRTLPAPLRWHWSLAPGPRMEINHPWLAGGLTLLPGWEGITLSAQTLRLPAQALGTLDARIAAVDPGGELILAWPAVHLGADGMAVGTRLLDLEWRNALSALSPIRPLGSYHLGLRQGTDNRAELLLETRQGPLLMRGTGTLGLRGGAQFEGRAWADPAAPDDVHAALRDLLSALGPRRDDQTLLVFR